VNGQVGGVISLSYHSCGYMPGVPKIGYRAPVKCHCLLNLDSIPEPEGGLRQSKIEFCRVVTVIESFTRLKREYEHSSLEGRFSSSYETDWEAWTLPRQPKIGGWWSS
jgi:hypothetical protein